MASIALIAKKISPQVLETAKGLYQHRNEVKIISSHNQKPNGIYEFQILTYFKKWSLLEALRLIPKILLHPPDVFHFFFEDESDSATAAHWALLSFAQSLNKATVVSLLGKKIHSKNWRYNPFLKFSKAITVPTRERLMYLKRRKLISPENLNEVILPLQEPLIELKFHDEELSHFLKTIQPYIFVPTHPLLEFLQQLQIITQNTDYNILFLGPRTKNLRRFKRFYAVNIENPFALEQIAMSARCILLAFHEFDLSELMNWQYLSHKVEVPLIVRGQQIEVLPGLCLQDKNGFIIQKDALSLHKLLLNNPELKIQAFYKNKALLPSVDHSLNELSRLYAKALNI